MKLLNRSALIVRYREPFLRWASGIDDDDPTGPADLRESVSVYLVPPDPAEREESAPIGEFLTAIFEYELESWCSDQELWPPQRDAAAFAAWFDVTTESMVIDLALGKLRAEAF